MGLVLLRMKGWAKTETLGGLAFPKLPTLLSLRDNDCLHLSLLASLWVPKTQKCVEQE